MIHGIWGHKRPRTSRQVLYMKRTNRMGITVCVHWLSRFGFAHLLLKIYGLRLYGLWLKQVLVSMSFFSSYQTAHHLACAYSEFILRQSFKRSIRISSAEGPARQDDSPYTGQRNTGKRACKLLFQTRGHSDSFVCLNGIHFSIISCILMLIFLLVCTYWFETELKNVFSFKVYGYLNFKLISFLHISC